MRPRDGRAQLVDARRNHRQPGHRRRRPRRKLYVRPGHRFGPSSYPELAVDADRAVHHGPGAHSEPLRDLMFCPAGHEFVYHFELTFGELGVRQVGHARAACIDRARSRPRTAGRSGPRPPDARLPAVLVAGVALGLEVGAQVGAQLINDHAVIPTPDCLGSATDYRFRPDFCHPADSESKEIVEPRRLHEDRLRAAHQRRSDCDQAPSVEWCGELDERQRDVHHPG